MKIPMQWSDTILKFKTSTGVTVKVETWPEVDDLFIDTREEHDIVLSDEPGEGFLPMLRTHLEDRSLWGDGSDDSHIWILKGKFRPIAIRLCDKWMEELFPGKTTLYVKGVALP